jgi:4-amino-4-deoxy-L-arabinose transferase-like glycosyltransferase
MRRRIPRLAWACALVALLNGLAWSLLTPPFQVPDENAHFAYVQQLAERGLPHVVNPEGYFSPAQDEVLAGVDFYAIVGRPHNPALFSELQQKRVETIQRSRLSRVGTGDAFTATNNPPLYYAMQVIPYKLAGGSVLDQLSAMRFLSVLMGAITVLLVYLFLAEALPGVPLACATGALVAALQPLFGFMSGGVNNDNLLYLCATGVLWAIARTFRRGLTPINGVLLGGFVGAGLLAKFTLLGFVPAATLAAVLMLWRGVRSGQPRVWLGAAWAAALGAGPVLVYYVLNKEVWHRNTIVGGLSKVATSTVGRHFDRLEELSHIWQLFMPNLWMTEQFPGYMPLWQTWFTGLVGRFGWLDYEFPLWVDDLALVLLIVVVVLALSELVRRRGAVLRRAGELVVYALVPIGLCVVIGVQSYNQYVASGSIFEQPRYLLPLLGLYAGLVALAVRAGGRRFAAPLAVALVVLAVGHDIYGQALTIARYYT